MSVVKKIRRSIGEKLRPDDRINLKNSIISSAGHVVTVLSLLVTTPLLLMKLGKDGTGIVMLVKTVLGIGGMVSIGMGQATLKFVSKYRAQKNRAKVSRVINTTLTFYTLIGSALCIGLFAVAGWLVNDAFKIGGANENEAINAFRIAALGLLGAMGCDALGSALRGFERFDLTVATESAVQVVLLIGQVVLLALGFGIVEVILLIAASRVGQAIVLAYLLCSRASPGHVLAPSLHKETLRESFGFGVYTWLGGVLNRFRTDGPPVILGVLVGTEAVAIYNVAVRVLEQFVRMLSRAGSYLFPYISRTHEQGDYEQVRKHYFQVTKILVILSTAGITPIFVCGSPLLSWWLGSEIATEVMGIARILALRFAVLPLGVLNYSFLVATGKVRALVVVQAIGALVMVASTLIGASFWGLEGAAWAQLSIFATMVGNRLFIEKNLFNEMNPLMHIAIALAPGAPLVAGIPFILGNDDPWWFFALSCAVWALAGAAGGWAVMTLADWLSRASGWMRPATPN